MPERSKHLETIVVLAAALVVVFLITDIREFLYGSLALALLGLLVPVVAKYVHLGWTGFAKALGWFNSHVLLGIVFFLILSPLALIRRLGKKDPLQLKRKAEGSYFVDRDHEFEAKDLENPW